MKAKTLSVSELTRRYRTREAKVTEVIANVFDAIDREDSRTGAFLSTCREDAMIEARRMDDALTRGETLPPLGGVPVAVKDNMNIRGVPTTCGSKILEGYVPPYTATAVRRLQEAGAIVVGKTNLDEFAMGSSTENSAFSPTRNPHDPSRVPGGSSGGSAACVAAGWVPVALGSDTGGSIRQPASFCGVVGVKPTYGRVSRYGLVAFASSLDQIGTLSGSVRDSAQVLECISGADPYDSTSAERSVESWTSELDQSIEGLRIGVPKEYFVDGLDPEVRQRVHEGIDALETIGCRTEQISLPHTEYAVATYYLIATAEASSNLARYDGVRYGMRVEASSLEDMYRRTRMGGFGREVQRRILLGTYALSAGYYDAYYLKAQKVRTLILEDFRKAFDKVDIIVTPTAPTPAFKLEEKTKDPLEMYLMDIFTLPSSLAGLPGVSVPCGVNSEGLPVGMQLIGNHFQESLILRAGHQLEQSRDRP